MGDGEVWDDDRYSRKREYVEVAKGRKVLVHDRTSAHVAAWQCVKRKPEDNGKRFTLLEGFYFLKFNVICHYY
eukprot:Pgem_evm2s2831